MFSYSEIINNVSVALPCRHGRVTKIRPAPPFTRSHALTRIHTYTYVHTLTGLEEVNLCCCQPTVYMVYESQFSRVIERAGVRHATANQIRPIRLLVCIIEHFKMFSIK